MASVHPFLPSELRKRFRKSDRDSYIFGPDFNSFRCKASKRPESPFTPREMTVDANIITQVQHAPLPSFVPSSIAMFDVKKFMGPAGLAENSDDFSANSRKSFLHIAAHQSDVPLAYELIRMGIVIDARDKDGVTPLLAAIGGLTSVKRARLAVELVLNSDRITALPFPEEVRRELYATSQAHYEKRAVRKHFDGLREIIRIIIEQHADVNYGAFSYTPLIAAVEAAEWDIVELLLRHGASRPSPGQAAFQRRGG